MLHLYMSSCRSAPLRAGPHDVDGALGGIRGGQVIALHGEQSLGTIYIRFRVQSGHRFGLVVDTQ